MRNILLAVTLCACAAPAASQRQQKQVGKGHTTHIEETKREGTTRIVMSDTDSGVEVDMNLKGVRFNDDYSDMESIAPDGFLELRESRLGETRKLDIEPDSSGRLRYRYRVRGDERPFDADARAWLARVMKERVDSGFDAAERVARIYRARGARGVLEAARTLRTGYARASYLNRLAQLDGPRDETAVEILRSAARDKFSDYERANVLVSIARRPPSGADARRSFFEATAALQSDYDRSRVLLALLRADRLEEDWALAAVRAVAASSSDYEKVRVLIAAARAYADKKKVLDAVLETSNGIGSDYERKRVLTATRGGVATREL